MFSYDLLKNGGLSFPSGEGGNDPLGGGGGPVSGGGGGGGFDDPFGDPFGGGSDPFQDNIIKDPLEVSVK